MGKETLYVSSFDSTTIGWAVTNTTPYLNDNDVSYVSGKNTLNCMIGTFHFADTAIASYSSITAMTLYVRWKDNNDVCEGQFIYYGSGAALGTVIIGGDGTSTYINTATNVLAKYTSLAEMNAAKGVLKKTTTAGTLIVSQAYIISTFTEAAGNTTISATLRLNNDSIVRNVAQTLTVKYNIGGSLPVSKDFTVKHNIIGSISTIYKDLTLLNPLQGNVFSWDTVLYPNYVDPIYGCREYVFGASSYEVRNISAVGCNTFYAWLRLYAIPTIGNLYAIGSTLCPATLVTSGAGTWDTTLTSTMSWNGASINSKESLNLYYYMSFDKTLQVYIGAQCDRDQVVKLSNTIYVVGYHVRVEKTATSSTAHIYFGDYGTYFDAGTISRIYTIKDEISKVLNSGSINWDYSPTVAYLGNILCTKSTTDLYNTINALTAWQDILMYSARWLKLGIQHESQIKAALNAGSLVNSLPLSNTVIGYAAHWDAYDREMLYAYKWANEYNTLTSKWNVTNAFAQLQAVWNSFHTGFLYYYSPGSIYNYSDRFYDESAQAMSAYLLLKEFGAAGALDTAQDMWASIQTKYWTDNRYYRYREDEVIYECESGFFLEVIMHLRYLMQDTSEISRLSTDIGDRLLKNAWESPQWGGPNKSYNACIHSYNEVVGSNVQRRLINTAGLIAALNGFYPALTQVQKDSFTVMCKTPGWYNFLKNSGLYVKEQFRYYSDNTLITSESNAIGMIVLFSRGIIPMTGYLAVPIEEIHYEYYYSMYDPQLMAFDLNNRRATLAVYAGTIGFNLAMGTIYVNFPADGVYQLQYDEGWDNITSTYMSTLPPRRYIAEAVARAARNVAIKHTSRGAAWGLLNLVSKNLSRTRSDIILKAKNAGKVLMDLFLKIPYVKERRQKDTVLLYKTLSRVSQQISLILGYIKNLKDNSINFASKILNRRIIELNLKYLLKSKILTNLISLYGIRQLTINKLSSAYGVLNKLFNSITLKYHVKSLRENTVRLLYGVKSAVNNNITSNYKLFSNVLTMITSNYNIKNRVLSSLSLLYNIKRNVQNGLTVAYRNLRNVQNTIKLVWGNAGKVLTSLILLFGVKNRVQQTVTLSYLLKAKVLQYINSVYFIKNLRSNNMALQYNIKNRILTSLTSLYNVKERIQKNVVLLFRNLSNVVSNFKVKYGLAGKLLTELILSFGVKNRIQQFLTLLDTVKSRALNAININYGIKNLRESYLKMVYGIKNTKETAITLINNIRSRVSSSVVLKYSSLYRLLNVLRVDYGIKNNISTQLKMLYNVKNKVLQSLVSLYNVRSGIQKNLRIIYGILENKANSLVSNYRLLNVRTQTLALLNAVKSEVQKALTLIYKQFGFARATLTIIYSGGLLRIKDLISVFSSRMHVLSSLTLVDTLKVYVANSIKLLYRSLGRVQGFLRLIFRNLNNATQNFNIKYDTRSQVIATVRLVYSMIGRVYKSLTLVYGAGLLVIGDISILFKAFENKYSSLNLTYNVKRRVQTSLISLHNMLNNVGLSLTAAYRILISKYTSIELQYRVKRLAQTSLSIMNNLRENITRSLRIIYNVSTIAEVYRNLVLMFSSRGRALVDMVSSFNSRSIVNNSISILHNIRKNVSNALIILNHVRQNITSSMRFRFGLAGKMAIDIILNHGIRVLLSSSTVLNHSIRRSLTATLITLQEVRGRIVTSLRSLYGIAGKMNIDLVLKHGFREFISNSIVIQAALKRNVTSTIIFLNSVRSRVLTMLKLLYGSGGVIFKDLVIHANIGELILIVNALLKSSAKSISLRISPAAELVKGKSTLALKRTKERIITTLKKLVTYRKS